MSKKFTVKMPGYGVAIARNQQGWALSLNANNKINLLYDHIIQMLQKALSLQHEIGVLSRNNRPVERWNGNPEIQLMIMRLKFDNHTGSILAVLIPTMGDHSQLEYAARVLIEDYEYFHAMATTYGLRPWLMQDDESMSFLTDLNNPIIKHIREQVEHYEENPLEALKDKRLILSNETVEYLKKELGPNNSWLF